MEQLDTRTVRLFDKVVSQLGKYSHFESNIVDEELHLSGLLDIGYGVRNQFKVKIVVTKDYPNRIPQVHETGGRVPSVLDRHYMSDGTGCCLVMPHRYREYFKPLMTFEDFVDILVVPFFKNQLYYEINGTFVQGYKHGELGIWEHYFEIFGSDLTSDILYKLVDTVLLQREDRKIRIKGHRACPCGSGLIQRRCHGKGLIQLKEFGSTNKLRDTKHWLQIEAYLRKVRKGEKFILPYTYGLKVQQIRTDELPKVKSNGVAVYNMPIVMPGIYKISDGA